MTNASRRPLPKPSPWSAPFWAAARERRLVIQVCGDCQTRTMYPKKFCPSCLSGKLGWMESTGRGDVYSFSIQLRAAPSFFVDRVPYVVAVIKLDEGVQLMSNIVGDRALEVACGDRVVVDFEPVPDSTIVLPVFRLDASAGQNAS
ncbi:MAG: Zn-ribbon domain-containing OB-fold protein [Dehalococcoidia bacterium]